MSSPCAAVLRSWLLSTPKIPQALCKDARMLAGGGAAEIEVARRLAEYGRKQTGLDQYAIAKFAEALEVVPRWVFCVLAWHGVYAGGGGSARPPSLQRRSRSRPGGFTVLICIVELLLGASGDTSAHFLCLAPRLFLHGE